MPPLDRPASRKHEDRQHGIYSRVVPNTKTPRLNPGAFSYVRVNAKNSVRAEAQRTQRSGVSPTAYPYRLLRVLCASVRTIFLNLQSTRRTSYVTP